MTRSTRSRLSDQVVEHIRRLIEDGKLRPGDRLPTERELTIQFGVSRPSVRAGLQALAAIGVVTARRGSGTYLADGPPVLDSEGLRLQAALYGVPRAEMFEARQLLEVGAARLAAERADGEHILAICHEVMEMFASLGEPQRFLVHDVLFHRAVARASGNQVVVALVDMVSALFYERRKATIDHHPDLDVTAEYHRRIYEAIRDHDPERAAAQMESHLAEGLRIQEIMDGHLAGELRLRAVDDEPRLRLAANQGHGR